MAERSRVGQVSCSSVTARGIEEFPTLTRLVAERAGDVAVQPAFLELAEPTIAQGLAKLAEREAVEQASSLPGRRHPSWAVDKSRRAGRTYWPAGPPRRRDVLTPR